MEGAGRGSAQRTPTQLRAIRSAGCGQQLSGAWRAAVRDRDRGRATGAAYRPTREEQQAALRTGLGRAADDAQGRQLLLEVRAGARLAQGGLGLGELRLS